MPSYNTWYNLSCLDYCYTVKVLHAIRWRVKNWFSRRTYFWMYIYQERFWILLWHFCGIHKFNSQTSLHQNQICGFHRSKKIFLPNGRKMKINCNTSSNLPLSNKYKVIFVVQVLTYVILHIYSVLHYIVHMW